MPLVSVVMTSFNHSRYVASALLSLINQDYPNVQIIVVDDGSTDASLDILKSLSKSYKFKLISKPNGGLVDTINHGFQYADGEYVLFHGSDDVSFPYRITQQVDALSNCKTAGYITSNFIFIDDENSCFDIRASSRSLAYYSFHDFMKGRAKSVIVASLFRRQAVSAIMPLEIKFKSEDFQLFAKVTHSGWDCLELCHKPVIAYRIHGQGLSSLKLTELMYAQREMLGLFSDHPYYYRAVRDCNNQIFNSMLDRDKIGALRFAINNKVNIFSKHSRRASLKLLLPRAAVLALKHKSRRKYFPNLAKDVSYISDDFEEINYTEYLYKNAMHPDVAKII